MGTKCRPKFDGEKVKRRVASGSFKSLNHAAAAIRLTARRSIRRSKKESAPGTPPNTRRGLMKRAIVYNLDKMKMVAVIGPAYSIAGKSGKAHEFGGMYFGRKYPKRPFMAPALEANRARLSKYWACSVK